MSGFCGKQLCRSCNLPMKSPCKKIQEEAIGVCWCGGGWGVLRRERWGIRDLSFVPWKEATLLSIHARIFPWNSSSQLHPPHLHVAVSQESKCHSDLLPQHTHLAPPPESFISGHGSLSVHSHSQTTGRPPGYDPSLAPHPALSLVLYAIAMESSLLSLFTAATLLQSPFCLTWTAVAAA